MKRLLMSSPVAVASTTALIILVVTSIWRKLLKILYEPWRILHGILAVAIIALELVHALGVSYYLSLFWKSVLWSAISLTALWLLIYVRLIKPWFMTKKPYLVEEVISRRDNIWTLALRSRGHQEMQFQPGQFAWITLDISPFRMREHPFSISSFGESAIAIASPVDSCLWWILLLRTYIKTAGDLALAYRPEFQEGIRLILDLSKKQDVSNWLTLPLN
jgi:predicted ferric reductase